MKALLVEVGIVLAEVLAVCLVIYLFYRKWIAPAAAVVPTAAEVKQGVVDIWKGLPGAAGNIITGNDGSGYLTDAQMRANAAANLAAHRRALGAA